MQTDANRHAFGRIEQPPTAGDSLELTIDGQLQHVVERELAIGVRENGADGGSALVMDPWTGELLALANYPTFNPKRFASLTTTLAAIARSRTCTSRGRRSRSSPRRRRSSRRWCKPDDQIDVTGGTIRFGSRVIHDTHNYGVLSFTDVIVKSSNVGAIKIGLRLGKERLGEYVRKFGFGRRASPDFPGENSGIVWNPEKMNDSALASMSMGYQVARHSAADGRSGEFDRQRRGAARAAGCPRGDPQWPSPAGAAEGGWSDRRPGDRGGTDADHGEGRHGRDRTGRADRRLHGRGEDRHRGTADQRPLLDHGLQRVVRRIRPVAHAACSRSSW